MVAIVGGAGLGLDRSSAKVFAAVGQQGGQLGDAAFGRYGENVFVNAADGNLMIDRTDEVLIGRGPDDVITRSYNSQSANQGYQTHNGWQISDQRAIVGLSTNVAVNHAGSTVTRIDSDGSDTVYTYVSDTGDAAYGTYVSRIAGNGEYRLTYSSGTWTWNDAKNNLTETYDDTNGGRLSGTTDGLNALTYTYDPTTGHLTTITTDDGEATQLTWSGGNKLTQITVLDTSSGVIESRTSYDYYPSGRLKTVTTDLSPTTALGSDKVVTTYTYVGSSDLVSSITQTGGAELDITYDTSNRVHSLSLVTASGATPRSTVFTYNSSTSTTVTDNNGQNTDLTFDTSGQLLSVTYPPATIGAARETYSYTYQSDGCLKSVTDPLGHITKYGYDGNDNLTSVKDDNLNTTTYAYDGNNHVTSKTYTPGNDPGSATTIRYAYVQYASGTKELLRFIVDGDGEVTEYRYDDPALAPSHGQLTAAIVYRNDTYTTTGTITESGLASWVASADKSAVLRTDYTYDFRGNLATEKSYSACDSSGAGLTSQTYTTITYTYDQFGKLLTRQTSGMSNTEAFLYDGLGRLISSTDLNAATTTMAWTDSSNTCLVTLANGHTTTTVYDAAGELVSSTESSPGGTTNYQYDSLGRLSIVTDPTSPTGVKSYFLYDALGRKTADIAADGSITEYRYDQDNNLIATISYASKLTSTQLGLLVSGGVPTNVDVSSVRPTPSAVNDDWSWRVYDNIGRLTETIDSDGGVTAFAYDDMSNLISTTCYYNKLNVATAGTGGTSLQVNLPTVNVLPTANSAKDDTTRTFYDSENRVVGTLNDDGYLSEIVYDHAGLKTDTIVYGTKVASGDMGDDFATLKTDVGTSSADEHTRYYYDDRGLLIYSLNASLYATRYTYDAAGNLTNTLAYGAPITSAGSYPLSYIQSETGLLSLNSGNRNSWAVYDAATGNLAYSIDANGGVASFAYDVMGNVTSQTRYATSRATTSGPSQSTMASWVSANASSTTDRTTRMVYDGMNRLVFAVDSENYVTENRYDAAGRIKLQVRYAAVCSLTGTLSQSAMDTWKGSSIPSTAVQTSYGYDPDGRLIDTIDDAGGLAIDTKTTYDALGRVIDVEVAHGTSDAATTHRTYDSAGRLLTETRAFGTADAATISYTSYDGMGNVLTAQDPDGNTTTYTYDALGQMLTKTDALSNVTAYTYDAFGNVLTTTDPLSGVVYSFYNTLNQLTLQIDQGKYATATTYSIGGAVTSITRYAAPVTGTITPGVPPTLTTNALDATTTFTLDKLDRVTKVTDAEGFYEKYVLDAFGNRTSVYAKASSGTIGDGGLTTNAYDRRGLLVAQTQAITYTDSDGSSHPATITNTYTYDARGNRTQMIEAYGLPEARTTNYTYDHLDRLTQVQRVYSASVSVVDDTNINTTTSISSQITNTYFYDGRGNVTQSTDAAGASTWSYYDDLNRKIAEINAVGMYSAWTYDDNGNMLTARMYDSPLASLPSSPGGSPPSPVHPTQYRQTVYTYDAINRLLTTTVASLLTGSYSGSSYTTTTGDVTTANTYNKTVNGLHQTDGNGNSTWAYYNKLGQKIAEVDQNNYITKYTLDANGNVTAETRYAVAYSGTITDSTALSTLTSYATAHADSTNDRTTTFDYDRDGNRWREQRTNVDSYTVGTTGTLMHSATATATILYTYNGLGEVLTKTEATGDATTYLYDSGGRQREILGTTFANASGGSVRSRTDESYDGLGDLTATDMYDNLGGGSTIHRITSYAYDAAGRLATMTDAEGFVRTYAYDAAGRVVLVSYGRVHSNGTTITTEGDVTQYDLLGRVVGQGTATQTSGTWALNDMQGTDYTLFGEVADRTINGTVQQTFIYDDGGRMSMSTDEGIETFYLYDKTGNQTLSVTSDGTALPSGYAWNTMDIDDAVTLMKNGGSTIGGVVAGVVETMTVYDARGQAIQTRMPQRQLAAGATPVTITTSRTYNAFGEVASETDGNGNVTTFTYNTIGKVIVETLPAVLYTDDSGTTSSTAVNPVLNNYYDVSGRLVGVVDANGNVNTRALLANTGYGGSDALVAKEFHADTGIVTNDYDAFGDVTKATNEVGSTTSNVYDKLGRLTQVTHPISQSGSHLIDYYSYDGLGQRLAHWNSQLTASVKSTADYDAEGRVTQTVDMDGYITGTSYAWTTTSMLTSGLGNFGGWVITTTNPAGLTHAVRQNADGRIIKDTDFGGYNTTYTYDSAGRVIDKSIGSGADEVTTYFNTGLKAQVSSTTQQLGHDEDGHIHGMDYFLLRANYAYDRNGNETFEDSHNITWNVYSGTTTGYTDTLTASETATFDALDRMTEMDDVAPGSLPSGVTNGIADPATIAIKYDLNNNVRERLSTFHLLDNWGAVSSTTTTQDDWYKYDTMNRFTTTRGTLSGSSIVMGSSGAVLTYDLAGERKTAQMLEYGTSTTETDTYTYAFDGYLKQTVFSTGAGEKKAVYTVDLMGRTTVYKEYSTSTAVVYERDATYDNDSLVTDDTVTSVRSDGTFTWATHYDYKEDTNADGDYTDTGDEFLGGVVTHTHATETAGGSDYTDSRYLYDWRNTAQERAETYQLNGSTGTSSLLTYDGRNELVDANIKDGQIRHVLYQYNSDGEIVARDTVDPSSTAPISGPHERYYYFGGLQIGDVSNDGTSNVDYVTAIHDHIAKPSTGLFQNGALSGSAYADFDQSFDKINGLTYQGAPQSYTVSSGDTLQSIAQTMWGDSSFWYLIADANGLNNTSTLIAGTTLIIPNKVANAHNSSSTYNVYDPNEHIGDISPTAPPKPQNHNCGIIGQILQMIVTVAVTLMGAGPIIGDAFGQLFGIAIGNQKSFNWKEFGMTVVTAGINGGLSKLGVFADDFMGQFEQGVTSSAISQGIGVATGLQKSFSWSEVAAAGISQGLNAEVRGHLGIAMPGISDTGVRFAAGMAGDIAFAATKSLIDGSDFGDSILKGLPSVLSQGLSSAPVARAESMGKAGSVDIDDSAPPPPQADGSLAGVEHQYANPQYDNMYFKRDPRDAQGLAPSTSLDDELAGGTQVITGDGVDDPWTVQLTPMKVLLPDGTIGDAENVVVTGTKTPTSDHSSLGSALLDSGRAFVNNLLDLGEFAEFALGNGNAFGSQNEQFRLRYDTPLFGYSMELLFGIATGGAVGDLAKASQALKFATTEPVLISGSQASGDLSASYEAAIRGMYSDASKEERAYTAIVDGQEVSGAADDVTVIDGKPTAIEAKYTDNWDESIRNPNSPAGSKLWGVAAQEDMITQARKYSAGFEGGVVYHTNSAELATYYTQLFNSAGIGNFRFVITPAIRY